MHRRLLTAAALALLLPACGGDDEAGPTPGATVTTTATGSPSPAPSLTGSASPAFVGKLIRVFVENGKVTNDVARRQQVRRGETVRIEVVSDRANELHVHGYDLRADLAPNVKGAVEFEARVTGSFEVELESPKVLLFELQVR